MSKKRSFQSSSQVCSINEELSSSSQRQTSILSFVSSASKQLKLKPRSCPNGNPDDDDENNENQMDMELPTSPEPQSKSMATMTATKDNSKDPNSAPRRCTPESSLKQQPPLSASSLRVNDDDGETNGDDDEKTKSPTSGRTCQPPLKNFSTSSTTTISPSTGSLTLRTEQTTDKNKGKNIPDIPTTASNNNNKKKKTQQLCLDFGQRSLGRRSICDICGMLTVQGVAEDAKQHAKVCDHYKYGVPFSVKVGRRIVFQKTITTTKTKTQSSSGGVAMIVCIRPTDTEASLRQKVQQAHEICMPELGMQHHNLNSTTTTATTTSSGGSRPLTTFLYIRQKRIVGVCTVEPISTAYRMVTDSERSLHPETITTSKATTQTTTSQRYLGIYLLWVHKNHRRQQIAKELVETARYKTAYGWTVPPQHVAFSSPTQAGLAFAKKYYAASSSDDVEPQQVHPLVYEYHHQAASSSSNNKKKQHKANK